MGTSVLLPSLHSFHFVVPVPVLAIPHLTKLNPCTGAGTGADPHGHHPMATLLSPLSLSPPSLYHTSMEIVSKLRGHVAAVCAVTSNGLQLASGGEVIKRFLQAD